MIRIAYAAAVSVLAMGVSVPAAAATAGVVSAPNIGTLVYTAGSGQVNDPSVTVEYGPDDASFVHFWVTIHDRFPLTAGKSCVHPDQNDPTTVRCDIFEQTLGDPEIYLDLGDKDDRWADRWAGFRRLVIHVHGGPGNDRISAQQAGRFYGDAGNDVISGNGGILGGTGNDTITGILAKGEDGNDRITALAGAGDARLWGGPGNDTIAGGSGDDAIAGDAGADRLTGGTGNDRLWGGAGGDAMYGNSGADRLQGDDGNDKLYGGPGIDRLSGGAGQDLVRQD